MNDKASKIINEAYEAVFEMKEEEFLEEEVQKNVEEPKKQNEMP